MASQREYESVIWYYLRERLQVAMTEELYEFFYSSQNVPHTQTQHKRFEVAVAKVADQMKKFEGEERP